MTATLSPGVAVLGFSASVVPASTVEHTPSVSSRTSSTAAPMAMLRLVCRRHLGAKPAAGEGTRGVWPAVGAAACSIACAAGVTAGNGIATVAAACLGGAAATAAATGSAAAGASGIVAATGGVRTMVLVPVPIVPMSSAEASASTNAVDDSQRAAGSLASPRMITASTRGPRLAMRLLGEPGSRWTCA